MKGPGRLWRHPDFLKLWTGESVSVLGTSITTLALPTLAILKLHAGPFQVGLLVALPRLPFAVLSLPAGAWIDRLRRRSLLIMCDLGRLVVLASIPIAAVLGSLTLIHLYAVALIVGVFTVFFDIAYLAYLPSLIEPEDLLEGNQKFEITYAVSSIAGPGLGGVLVTAFGAAQAVAADAFSYLASAGALLAIRTPEPKPVPSGASFRQDLGEGLRFTFGHPVLGTLLLGMSGLLFGGHAAEALTYVYAYGPLHLTPAVVGGVLTVVGLAGMAGALTSGPVSRALGTGRTVALTAVLYGVTLGLLPLAQLLPAAPTLIVLLGLGAFQSPINNVTQISLRQRLTPPRLHGRMNAVFRLVYFTAWPLGNIAGGALGARIGLSSTFYISAFLATLGGVSMLLTPIGRYRD